jgi:hypothetical protein
VVNGLLGETVDELLNNHWHQDQQEHG